MGSPCIIGRKAWESLPKKPLPGRFNIIVTKNHKNFAFPNTGHSLAACESVEKAIGLGKQFTETGKVFVCGGNQIYSYCLSHDLIDRILVSEVDDDTAEGIHFPAFNWEGKTVREFPKFTVREYHRSSLLGKAYDEALSD